MSVQVKGSGTIGGLDEGLVVSGIVTSSTQVNVGSNIKLGNAGVVTATTFSGSGASLTNLPAANLTGTLPAISGANLTSLPSQVTIANNADNRVITGGSGTNLNGEANLIFNGSELYPASGIGTGVGHRLNYRRNPPESRTNTGSASIRYYKIGEIVLNGSESSEINIYGTAGYSAGQEVAGKTTIIMRATNGGTLVGFWYEESLGAINLSDVRWKYTGSNNVYELWVQANNYSNIAPFVRCTGNGYTSFNTDTGSNTAPSGSTGFSTYNRKIIGTNSTIRYNSTDTTFHRNIKMDSGYGIDFSATANGSGTMENELLDDYEEGTWVPVYNNVNTPTYGHRSGRYTKIGRFVYLVCQISVDSGLDTSDGSTVNIGGFPFAGNSAHSSCLFQLGQYIDVMPDSTIDLFTNVRFNSTSVMLHEGRNNQDITYTQLNSSGNLQFACSYAL